MSARAAPLRLAAAAFQAPLARVTVRMASSTAGTTATPSPSKDWSAAQYLKFADERTRAVHDLVSRVPLPGGRLPVGPATSSLRIVDLGCGPGNSTAVLAQRFPGAQLAGVDTSPNMIERAQATLPDVAFSLGDVRTFATASSTTADPPPDLLLANAVFQWLGLEERLPTVVRLLQGLRPGGALAYQVPDNKEEPSHRAMREVARGEAARGEATQDRTAPGTGPSSPPWLPYLRDLVDRDPIESPEHIYDTLVPHCASVDIWHSHYYHVLPGGAADIVEWVKGTGLQPFLHALPADGPVRDAYLAAYQRRLEQYYTTRADGSVLICYPRLFVVAVRK